MAYVKGQPFFWQLQNASSANASGYYVRFYLTGTTTPTPIYFDSAGSASAFFVILNSSGIPTNGGTEVDLYFDSNITYKIQVYQDSSTDSPFGPTISYYSPLGAFEQTAAKTTAAKTWYVNSGTGSDATGDGSAGSPFATIQKAYDSIPEIVTHQQTIQLSDGTYNSNYLGSATSVETPRPAVLFARGKFVAGRTQKNGSALEGGIIIKGNSSTPSSVVIELNDTYTYGVYLSEAQIGLQDLHVNTNGSATSVDNLLTSHRAGSFLHCLNVSLDGVDKTVTSVGMLTEGGGNIEFTTTTSNVVIQSAATLLQASSKGDNLTVAGNWDLDDCDTAVSSSNGGRVDLTASGQTGQTITNCSSEAFNIQWNSYLRVRGASDSDHIAVTGDVVAYNGGVIEFVWTDVDGSTDIKNGSAVYFNNSDYQNQVLVDAANVWFGNADSFISPATANDAVKPVLLRNGGKMYESGTNNFNGSGGDGAHVANVLEQTITANSQTINVTSAHDAVRLNAASDYTSLVLAAGYEGQAIDIFNYGGPYTEIIDSTTADIQTGAIKLSASAAAGEYSGIRMRYFGGKWREISRSLAGA